MVKSPSLGHDTDHSNTHEICVLPTSHTTDVEVGLRRCEKNKVMRLVTREDGAL
jgi:hypothetical protein